MSQFLKAWLHKFSKYRPKVNDVLSLGEVRIPFFSQQKKVPPLESMLTVINTETKGCGTVAVVTNW